MLGNGGYDVSHYHLDLRYGTSASTDPIVGSVSIDARAEVALDRFNLDFSGSGVTGVEVDGRPASWRRQGEELVVTPSRPLLADRSFTVRVSGFSATPVPPAPGEVFPAPLVSTPDGSLVAAQPDGAHAIFPCNDHPSDPASFSFRLDVPTGTTAVANGVFTGRRVEAGRTTWSYRQRQPMATELVQLAVGDFTVQTGRSHTGTPQRDVTPRRLGEAFAVATAASPDHLAWLEDRIGRYPFDVYGSLIVDAGLDFALETQTLNLYDEAIFQRSPALWNSLMVHELAHSWYGNLVTPRTWSDVWLNEGHASWYEFTYADEMSFLPDHDYIGVRDLETLMQLVYAYSDRWRQRYGPVAEPVGGSTLDLFNVNVYYGGAMVLFALRQELGQETFDRLQRVWPERFRGGPASTDDFIALASEVTGRDLTGFLTPWLYEETTPPMPGYPEWTVLPVEHPVTVPPADAAGAAARQGPEAGTEAGTGDDPLAAGFRARFRG
jgi:aminopeptidase N